MLEQVVWAGGFLEPSSNWVQHAADYGSNAKALKKRKGFALLLPSEASWIQGPAGLHFPAALKSVLRSCGLLEWLYVWWQADCI